MADHIQRVAWGLLGEWWCVPSVMTDEEVGKQLAPHFTPPGNAPVLDRLWGGFLCAQDPGRRHVYLGTGHYTYTCPEHNGALDPQDRASQWHDLLDANVADGWPGGGPATHDSPKAPR